MSRQTDSDSLFISIQNSINQIQKDLSLLSRDVARLAVLIGHAGERNTEIIMQPDKDERLDRYIDTKTLSKRVVNALGRSNFKVYRDFTYISREGILALPGIGTLHAQEIFLHLEEQGINIPDNRNDEIPVPDIKPGTPVILRVNTPVYPAGTVLTLKETRNIYKHKYGFSSYICLDKKECEVSLSPGQFVETITSV